MQPSSYANNQQMNSQMQAAFNPVFGNTSFTVTAPQNGELMKSFPEIPYFSLEAIAYQQQLSANQVRSGNSTGTQNINGTYNVTDSSGNTRLTMGFSQGAF